MIPSILVIKLINAVLSKRMQIPKARMVSIGDLKSMVRSSLFFWRYKVPALLSFKGLMQPECGYTLFVNYLIINAKKVGVNIICDEINNIEIKGGKNTISLTSGSGIICEMIYMPESAEIINIKSMEKVLGPLKKIKKTSYWHISILLYNEIDKNKVPEYIHLPDNIYFQRITYDQHGFGGWGRQFLFQCRFNPADTEYDIKALISKILLQTNICYSNPLFDIKHIFSEDLIANGSNCMFSRAEVYNTITIFPSIGDIARNIAINPFFRNKQYFQ
jgi:hypothetical protein